MMADCFIWNRHTYLTKQQFTHFSNGLPFRCAIIIWKAKIIIHTIVKCSFLQTFVTNVSSYSRRVGIGFDGKLGYRLHSMEVRYNNDGKFLYENVSIILNLYGIYIQCPISRFLMYSDFTFFSSTIPKIDRPFFFMSVVILLFFPFFV